MSWTDLDANPMLSRMRVGAMLGVFGIIDALGVFLEVLGILDGF